MPNIGSLLKEEITRLARKEMRSAIDPLRKQIASQRKDIAALKRDRDHLSRAVKKAAKRPGDAVASSDAHSVDSVPARFSAAGFKTLRQRLGLSATEMGKLTGVSGQSVYNWESGHSRPRASQLSQIVRVRSLGKKAAHRELESAATSASAPKRKAANSKPRQAAK